MTLVLNEVHVLKGLRHTMLVAAADRQITNYNPGPGVERYENQRKLFPIPRLKGGTFNGAASFFGLAWWKINPADPKEQRTAMWELLPTFIAEQASVAADLREFSFNLRAKLESTIPKSILIKERSGFHICGYGVDGIPEFWYLTNIRSLDGYEVTELKDYYKAPAPDFRAHMEKLGWDGVNLASVDDARGVATYRNGDIRGHQILWDNLETVFKHMWQFPDFKQPTAFEDRVRLTKFKFEILGRLYQDWASPRTIGSEIDIMAWIGDADKKQSQRLAV